MADLVTTVDLDAASAAGIVVTNVPDYSVEEVATHALSLILASLRKIPIAYRSLRNGEWGVDSVRPIRRLSTLTVGLVGYGHRRSLHPSDGSDQLFPRDRPGIRRG
ncbi:MAG: hypothetical protein IID40_12350 [Planctomycetes bacterium]|nr:hypothetical protein [Planctomycetota bacterium]